MQLSGLLIQTGVVFEEYFKGRLIFPMWMGGKVVNFVSMGDKEKLGTPDNKYEQAKYKKLLTHSGKHPYVREELLDRPLYGETTIPNSDICFITDDVADAVALHQKGYSGLSPIGAVFSESVMNLIAATCIEHDIVYVCSDLCDVGSKLEARGLNVRLLELTKPDDVNKVSIGKYLSERDIDYAALLNNSKQIVEYHLEKYKVSDKPDINLDTAKKFLETLTVYPIDSVKQMIQYNIKGHFKFKTQDCKRLTDYILQSRMEADRKKKDEKHLWVVVLYLLNIAWWSPMGVKSVCVVQ